MNQYVKNLYLFFLCVQIDGFNNPIVKLLYEYHDYNSMTEFLQEYTKYYSNIASLYSIGKSVQDRELWVVKISTNATNVNNIKFVGNIHGNEVVGKEVLLHLLVYLAENYDTDERIKHILKHNDLHILPSLNPDGYERSLMENCVSGPGRKNANMKDLNRDYRSNENYSFQPETLAIMSWMNQTKFTLSVSLHGGALVVNYPLDSRNRSGNRAENITPDEDVFRHLALTYSKTHPSMHLGKSCEGDYVEFVDGITNGAAWYSISGSMQDYNYVVHGTMELTLEVSCCKFPHQRNIRRLFEENRDALIELSLESGHGIKGVLHDLDTNNPIPNAIIKIYERNVTFYTTYKGEFARILLPGSYILQISASHYKNTEVPFEVIRPIENNFPVMTFLKLYLEPI